jgi:hypothetical protein
MNCLRCIQHHKHIIALLVHEICEVEPICPNCVVEQYSLDFTVVLYLAEVGGSSSLIYRLGWLMVSLLLLLRGLSSEELVKVVK